jgi:hypothetical protein
MASASRVAEQQLAADQEALRRREALHASELTAEEARVAAETPVRLPKLARETAVLREELVVQQLRNRQQAAEVEHDLLLPRAEQDLRREILPLEQAPQLVEAASRVFQGTSLSIWGDNATALGQVAALVDLLARAVSQAAPGEPPTASPGNGSSSQGSWPRARSQQRASASGLRFRRPTEDRRRTAARRTAAGTPYTAVRGGMRSYSRRAQK